MHYRHVSNFSLIANFHKECLGAFTTHSHSKLHSNISNAPLAIAVKLTAEEMLFPLGTPCSFIYVLHKQCGNKSYFHLGSFQSTTLSVASVPPTSRYPSRSLIPILVHQQSRASALFLWHNSHTKFRTNRPAC